MATLAPTAPTAADARRLVEKYNRIFGVDGFLRRHNVERDEDIELLGLCTIAGVDPLFLGDPGIGKTWMIELMVDHCMTAMALFTHLFAKDQSADEVLGPRDVMAMKQSKIARMTDGFTPTANYAYWDEVFKASPPMLNPMLDLLANRKLKVGGTVLDCSQLIAIFMSSNELPDREDLTAFRNRIGVTKLVRPVRTPEGLRAVSDIQLDFLSNGIDDSDVDPLTLDDIYGLRALWRQVTVNDAIRQVMTDIELKLLEAGHHPGQRRKRDMWRMGLTRAVVSGRVEMTVDDFLPSQYMAWEHPDHEASAREIILEYASVFTRKAQRLREAMEPVVSSMETLRAKLDGVQEESEKDDLLAEGYPLLRQLRKLRSDANAQIKDGKDQGQDTTLLTNVLADITRSYKWAEAALTGTDEED